MIENEIYYCTDGTQTILNKALNETYHSRHGSIAESQHVFIKNGLAFFVLSEPKQTITIFEVGFGTGLNAWLTLQFAASNRLNIKYYAIEKYPLQEEIVLKLNYSAHNQPEHATFLAMHRAPWNNTVAITPYFTLTKLHHDLTTAELPFNADLVYFDAFAPDKQPVLWSSYILNKMYSLLSKNGIFVTYSSKGDVKRALKHAGFLVNRLEGPPYKRHMLQAIKI